jgi:hypothetical protein
MYPGMFFRKVAYTRYDVSWFAEWMDYSMFFGVMYKISTIVTTLSVLTIATYFPAVSGLKYHY